GEWTTPHGSCLLALFDVETEAGDVARYFMPLSIVYEDSDESRMQKLQPGVIARVRRQAAVGVVADSASDENFCISLVEAIGAGGETETEGGVIQFSATKAFGPLMEESGGDLSLSAQRAQGTNTTLRLGDKFFL